VVEYASGAGAIAACDDDWRRAAGCIGRRCRVGTTRGVHYAGPDGNAARASTLIRVIPVPTAQARAAYDDIGAAFRALNVRYLAEGEVRQGQDSTLVGVRLVNAKTGEQSWSESVSLKDADTPDARSRALHAIAWHLSRSLISAELRRVAAQPPGEAAPLDSVLRALALDRTEPDSLKRAREKEKLFDQALQRDPNLVPALVGLAGVLVQKIEYDIRADRDRLVQRMDDLTSKAVRLNESQPTTWFFRSIALMFMGQWNASLEASAKAVRLEPYSSGLILNQASLMTLSGRPAEALMLVNQAMGMDPQGNPGQMAVACEAQLLLGHYEQAVTSCEKAKGLSGDNTMVDLFPLRRIRATWQRRKSDCRKGRRAKIDSGLHNCHAQSQALLGEPGVRSPCRRAPVLGHAQSGLRGAIARKLQSAPEVPGHGSRRYNVATPRAVRSSRQAAATSRR
jgi:tetratricopeptide (TPR) repeat protein